MKKKLLLIILLIILFFFNYRLLFSETNRPSAEISPTPRAYGCPTELDEIYKQKNTNEKCTTSYEEFKQNPYLFHFWTDDEKVTIEGRAKERARQFIFWVMNSPSIDNHPVLIKIWSSTRNLSYFLTILVAALLGLGIIIGQKTNFSTGVKLWPSIIKILISLFYITFSATIVISIIQLSDILMKFFIENLGGKDLFNTYFIGASKEANYDFFGIKDLNIPAQETVKNQLFVLKLTEITYYILGGVLILRKIILWFLLFVFPFLAILFSFSFLKNTGIIWIGFFFQWVFYGPLLGLFLSAVSTIWKSGIPFVFDFSRAGTAIGYVYPTATNVLWGGPAQNVSILNNVNYIDPYVEYIITLLMLWAAIFLPWWLLRSFRDYCCEGINSIKNILMSGVGNIYGSPASPFSPLFSSLKKSSISNLENIKKTVFDFKEIKKEEIKKIETVEEIKKAKTEEIVKSLNINASNLTEIAKIETNRQTAKTLDYLKNPTKTTNISERQKYINIRVEISNRAMKNDQIASRFVSSIFLPAHQQIQNKTLIIKSLPKTTNINQLVSYKVKLPISKAAQISTTTIKYANFNPSVVNQISKKVNLEEKVVANILTSLNQISEKSPNEILEKISYETKIEKEKIKSVIKEYYFAVKSDNKIIQEIANKIDVKPEEVEKAVDIQKNIISEPDKNIDEIIEIPQTVSIDEYEQVKKMWQNQYEKGEIPLDENIKSRDQWIERDIVFITNTLNKLYSSDETIKQKGLDEVGYILPIFMINNLNGEQLVVYLKAKLEAAKLVKALMDKEKEITEKLRMESEKIKIPVKKKNEEQKTMKTAEEIN